MGFANAFQHFTSLIRPIHKLRLMDGMKGYLHERKLPPPTTLFRAARIDREARALRRRILPSQVPLRPTFSLTLSPSSVV